MKMEAIFDTEWASLMKKERRLFWSIGNQVSISEKLD